MSIPCYPGSRDSAAFRRFNGFCQFVGRVFPPRFASTVKAFLLPRKIAVVTQWKGFVLSCCSVVSVCSSAQRLRRFIHGTFHGCVAQIETQFQRQVLNFRDKCRETKITSLCYSLLLGGYQGGLPLFRRENEGDITLNRNAQELEVTTTKGTTERCTPKVSPELDLSEALNL